MPWIQRTASGAITGWAKNRVPGIFEEEVAKDNAELVAFQTPPSAADQVEEQINESMLWTAWVQRTATADGKTTQQVIDEMRAAAG